MVTNEWLAVSRQQGRRVKKRLGREFERELTSGCKICPFSRSGVGTNGIRFKGRESSCRGYNLAKCESSYNLGF